MGISTVLSPATGILYASAAYHSGAFATLWKENAKCPVGEGGGRGGEERNDTAWNWQTGPKLTLLYGKVVLREIWTIDWFFLGLKFAILTVSMVISCVMFDFESWKIQNNHGPRAI